MMVLGKLGINNMAAMSIFTKEELEQFAKDDAIVRLDIFLD